MSNYPSSTVVSTVLAACFIATCLMAVASYGQENADVRAALFVQEFKSFEMNIEAAGVATISNPQLSTEGVLQFNYRYRSEGEDRSGTTKLQMVRPGFFEGNWATNADTGNKYSGSLYFQFQDDGQAQGKYQYAGSSYGIQLRRISGTSDVAPMNPSVTQTMTRQSVEVTSTGFTVHQVPPQGTENVFAFYKSNFGFVPNLTKIMVGSPALANSYVDLQNHLQSKGKLTPEEVNVVQMSIAVENQCEYCTAAHAIAGQSFFKTSPALIHAVRTRQAVDSPKLNSLRNFAITVYGKRGAVSQSEMQEFLDAGYTRDQALDIIACVAAKVMSNFTNSIAQTPVDEQFQPVAGQPQTSKQ
jgi:uncharacterized peroxidase-related enzyme